MNKGAPPIEWCAFCELCMEVLGSMTSLRFYDKPWAL